MTTTHPSRPVAAVDIPRNAAIHQQLTGAHFHDAYTTTDPHPAQPALQAWLDLVTRTPAWTRRLMALRNRLVRLVGLRDLGQLDDLEHHPQARLASHYRVGDRLGIFQIRHLSFEEVILGQDDQHLDVQVSLRKEQPGPEGGAPAMLVVSTVVHVHNALGHAYMAVVKPFHRCIVRAMLARIPAVTPALRASPPRHGSRG